MFPFHGQLGEAVLASLEVTACWICLWQGCCPVPLSHWSSHLLGLTCTMPSVNSSLQGQIHIVFSEMCVFDRADQPHHGKCRDSSFERFKNDY